MPFFLHLKSKNALLNIILLLTVYYIPYNIINIKTYRSGELGFSTGSNLLDAIVLSVVAKEDGTYGYKITQDVRSVMEVSESTLYPVLRRLLKENYLESYDMEFQGRNRRYYNITSNGMILLDSYRREWIEYKKSIDGILLGE